MLVFKTGTMGSGKTLELLALRHDYSAKGFKVYTVAPVADDRFGVGVLKSRAGMEANADIILEKDEALEINIIVDVFNGGHIGALVLVDEVQFLSPPSVDSLRRLSDKYPEVDVICFGIRTDFLTECFPGSKRMFELADEIYIRKTPCAFCGKMAAFNMRVNTFCRDQHLVGGSELYKEVCSECYAAEMGPEWDKN